MKGLSEIKRDNAPKAEPLAHRDPSVPCGMCAGSGRRFLTQIERNTLASVDSSWSSTATILFNLGGQLKHTALLNRLNDLAAYDLIERRRVGKGNEWRRL